MFDTIIIGAGPAGMTAGIYAARREMKTLIIGKIMGGQITYASEIENYPGFKKISNYELITKMREQTADLGVEIKTDEVKKIEKKENNFLVYTSKEQFEARTLIVAIGLSPRRLAIPGEEEFSGKGISYCANCDGPLYRGKTIAVVGGGNSALDAAEVMSKIAKKVYLIHRRDTFKGFETLVNKVKQQKNIELLLNSEVKEINGTKSVEKIKVINNQNQKEINLDIDGIFIEIGRIANTDLIKDFVETDERDQIIVNEKCATNAEGVFAAGDVTITVFKQITIACGQGTIAALSAYQYLQLKEGNEIKTVLDRSR